MKALITTALLGLVFLMTNCAATPTGQISTPGTINQIALFEDGQVIALGNEGEYFIGDISGNWSIQSKLSDLRLEFVDFTRSSEQGVYLIGGYTESVDGIVVTRGRTVLIDSTNKVIESWNYEANFNSAMVSGGGLIGSTGNNIFRLGKNGDLDPMYKRERSTLISVMVANNDEIIICNPYELRKSNTPFQKFGCFKGGDWEFEGQWFASTSKVNTEPQLCGDWIVEVVQEKPNGAISGIRIRDVENGKLRNEMSINGGSSLICTGNKVTVLGSEAANYLLPELSSAPASKCGRSVKSELRYNGKTMCLTDQGDVFNR